MKKIFVFLIIFISLKSFAQTKNVDSLNRLISKATSDTQRINLTVAVLKALSVVDLDSAITLSKKTINEAKKINYKKGEANIRISMAGNFCFKGEFTAAKENLDTVKEILSLVQDYSALARMYNTYGIMYAMQNKFDTSHIFYAKSIAIALAQKDNFTLALAFQNNAIAYQQQSNYPQALLYYQKALSASEQVNDEKAEAYIYLNIATTYDNIEDTVRSEQSYFKAINLAKKLNLKNVLAYAYANLSSLYAGMNRFKEQYDFGMRAAVLGRQMGDKGIEASSMSRAALGLAKQNKFEEAEKLSRQSMVIADSSNQPYNIYQTYSDMGAILRLQKKYSKAIPYFEKAFRSLTDADVYDAAVGTSYFNLSECYEKTGAYSKALATYKTSAIISDSIRGRENIKKATELTMNYEFKKKQELANAEQGKKDAITQKIKNQQFFIIAALAIVVLAALIITLIQFKNNRQKQKANLLLESQKQKVESTLSELKSTQSQLIQSEKMASLGELTAGIAHEIQNPLNFVNNFSEVSNELINEMKDELSKGNYEDANAIANDVKQNLERINHHGKRADAIVKGMLQHSKSSKGQKEPTDINALADEYLRLAYHGLRAKDKEFNATLKTEFDESIGNINIIPQDIGRVLLNLITNAFYATEEKQKALSLPTGQAGLKPAHQYEPLVSIETKNTDNHIEIKVSDNGNGVPQNIIDKIFQPFFTTKPTGQGTGLGLSLAYDIVKAHGGELKVETKEKEGTTFIIQLPIV